MLAFVSNYWLPVTCGMNVKQSGSFLETRDTVHVLGLSNFRGNILDIPTHSTDPFGVGRYRMSSRESRLTRRLCYPRQRPFSHLRRKIVNRNYHIFIVGNFSFFACHAPHKFSHFSNKIINCDFQRATQRPKTQRDAVRYSLTHLR